MSSTSSTSTDTSDKEWEVAELIATEAIIQYTNHINKQPYHNDSLSGKQYVINCLEGNENRSIDMFRMKTNVLYDLCDILRVRGLLRDTRYVTVEEQMCIFLYTIGHNQSNRTVADRFQHSGETVSRHFKTVLKAVCKFSKEVILPPNMTTTHSYLRSKDDKYYPWFKNCIGAIDGTHIPIAVPSGKVQIPYRGRKGIPTQNVMCACDFDMCFTFVLAGWEGSANDSRILQETIEYPQLNFPRPLLGKYYVVDSGYANAPGFLAPYRGQRYHLNEYSGHGRSPKTTKEQFNFAHASLRNIIERCFGVLKCRFQVLELMPSYNLRKQRNIVIASCALHNFIRKHALKDDFFETFEKEDIVVQGVGSSHETGQSSSSASEVQGDMGIVRDGICRGMSMFYRLPM